MSDSNRKQMYQIGISQLIGNYNVPEEYPFPKNMLWFWRDEKTNKTTAIEVMDVFQEIKQRVNILQVCDLLGIKLNRNRACLCPFHRENTPSFFCSFSSPSNSETGNPK